MKQAAVLIARFQTPSLQDAYKQLIDSLRARYATLVVVLRVAPVRGSQVDPFDFAVRKAMLQEVYPALPVLPLRDHPSGDA